MRTRTKSVMPLVVFAVLMVSYSGPMVKGALQAGATPVTIAFMRMFVSGLLLLPYELRQVKTQHMQFKVSREQIGWILLASLFLTGHYCTWISSLKGTSTFASVALVCTQPIFVALFSYILFREKLPKKAFPGAILALLGSVIISLSAFVGGGDVTGAEFTSNLLALSGAVLMAAHWLASHYIRKSLSSSIYTPILYFVTACFLGLLLPFNGGFVMPVEALPYMAGLIIGSTLLGHAIFTYTISHVSASVISFALLGEPVGAMVFSYFFFNEIPSGMVVLGGGLTLLGLWFYLFANAKTQPKV